MSIQEDPETTKLTPAETNESSDAKTTTDFIDLFKDLAKKNPFLSYLYGGKK